MGPRVLLCQCICHSLGVNLASNSQDNSRSVRITDLTTMHWRNQSLTYRYWYSTCINFGYTNFLYSASQAGLFQWKTKQNKSTSRGRESIWLPFGVYLLGTMINLFTKFEVKLMTTPLTTTTSDNSWCTEALCQISQKYKVPVTQFWINQSIQVTGTVWINHNTLEKIIIHN